MIGAHSLMLEFSINLTVRTFRPTLPKDAVLLRSELFFPFLVCLNDFS